MEIDLAIEGFGPGKSVEHTVIKHDNLEAVNTEKNPDEVKPRKAKGAKLAANSVKLTMQPHSYSMVRVQL